ncbi:MAG: hypothetical protein V4646_19185 [Pseudomonadota bacterium]
MDNIIVYVDDAAYALQMLQPMRLADGAHSSPARWIVVGCAPRVTHRASKWVTHSARESWRGKWAEKVFARLQPLLQQDGDSVVTLLAQTTLCAQTESLIKEYGVARVLDARRPKFGQDLQPVTAAQAQESNGVLGYVAALAGAGLLVATD